MAGSVSPVMHVGDAIVPQEQPLTASADDEEEADSSSDDEERQNNAVVGGLCDGLKAHVEIQQLREAAYGIQLLLNS